MEGLSRTKFRVGDWSVHPASGEISRGDETVRLEARTMGILLCLAERAGEVVSIDELLSRVWPGVIVTQDSVYQAVATLRRQLGDDPKQSTYIANVPRLGYRMVAQVVPWTEGLISSSGSDRTFPPSGDTDIRAKWVVAATIAVAVTVVVAWAALVRAREGRNPPVAASENLKSVAVLPFLDLTDGMKEEVFADGMTEELIDKLSKIPGLRVPAPTSSFYFKGKQVPLVDVAKTLGVTYVLDGSVRKSGARLRVAARLVRAENGYVIWSETYDRPLIDKLVVQEDIAGEVARALRQSIAGGDRAR
jgi:TolB-like protein/DNA-binding winged helix-turn-helix (wHTH) protein